MARMIDVPGVDGALEEANSLDRVRDRHPLLAPKGILEDQRSLGAMLLW